MKNKEIHKKVKVLSLGAGVQSSALLLMYERGDLGPKPDCAIFADTQTEPQSVYSWLKLLSRQTTIPIHVATKGSLIQDLYNHKTQRFVSMPIFIDKGGGKVGLGRRQCTREYKIDVITRELRRILGYKPRKKMKHKVTMVIGISLDEIQRQKPNRHVWAINTHPLINSEITRRDCIKYIEKLGLGTPPRSACYICPFRNNESWSALRNKDPKDFNRAVEFDDWLRGNFPATKDRAYLHRSLRPLRELEFNGDRQLDLFTNECEGVCGI